MMQEYIRERSKKIGAYIAETGCTVRTAAQKFGVSKSSVHKDATERLPGIDATLAEEVRKVLETNKAQRHLRGGKATLLKYHPEAADTMA